MRSIRCSGCRRYYVFVVLLTVCTVVDCPGDGFARTLDEIATAGAKHAQRIASVEYQTSGSTANSVRYFHEGSKFRVELLNEASIPSRIVSHNDAEYYFWERKGETLGRSVQPPSGRISPLTSNPLFVPYYWLFVLEDGYSWDVVCNASSWEHVLKGGHIGTVTEIKGVRCHPVTLEFPNTITRLFISERPSGFPMRWQIIERASENVLSESNISGFELRSDETGEFILPLRTSYEQKPSQFTVARQIESSIIPATLKVNHDIDDDLFTLSATHTGEVIDIDRLRSELSKSSSGIAMESGKGRVWLFLINAGVVVLIIGLLCRRRLLKANSRSAGDI